MKKSFSSLLALLGLFICTSMAAPNANDFPHLVQFEVGDTEFALGDQITITEVRGTMATFVTNETYYVAGTYTLSSRDEAELSLFVTVPNSGPSRVDPK